MGIGGSEIFFIFLIILIFFGADKIPEMARMIGKMMREFRKATDDIKEEISRSDLKKDIDELRDDLTEGANSARETLNQIKEDLKKPADHDKS